MVARCFAFACLVGLGLLVAGGLSTAIEPRADDPLTNEVTAMLTRQAEYWNQGDIAGFMQYYWKSDDLTFSSGGATRRGWGETMRRYREAYPTPDEMGKVSFAEIEVRRLGDTAALVLGQWSLDRDADPIGGNFTLVLEQIDGRWMIVHDHTSRLAAE